MKPLISLLPIESIKRGYYQPRNHFDLQALQELADSIKKNGLIQPIVVRPANNHEYELIAGERRWRACQMAGLTEISCIIKDYNDEQAAAVTTIENWQREDLNPIEMAKGLHKLIEEFGYLHEEVAAIISASRTKVTNLLRLLQLAEPVQQLLISGQISEGHGKMLAALPSSLQISLAQKAVANGWSVRKTEQMVKQESNKPPQEMSRDPNIKRLERLISDQLGANVELETQDGSGGCLKIKFFDNQTLTGLLQRMKINPEEL